MIWRVLMNQVIYMPKRFRVIQEQFDRIFSGISTEPSRSILCANYVNNNMGLVVSKLYIKQNFDKNARIQVKFNKQNMKQY